MDKLKKVKGIKDKFLVKMLAEYSGHKREAVYSKYLIDWAKNNVNEIKEFVADDAVLGSRLEKHYPLIEELCDNPKGIESDISIYLNCKYNLTK